MPEQQLNFAQTDFLALIQTRAENVAQIVEMQIGTIDFLPQRFPGALQIVVADDERSVLYRFDFFLQYFPLDKSRHHSFGHIHGAFVKRFPFVAARNHRAVFKARFAPERMQELAATKTAVHRANDGRLHMRVFFARAERERLSLFRARPGLIAPRFRRFVYQPAPVVERAAVEPPPAIGEIENLLEHRQLVVDRADRARALASAFEFNRGFQAQRFEIFQIAVSDALEVEIAEIFGQNLDMTTERVKRAPPGNLSTFIVVASWNDFHLAESARDFSEIRDPFRRAAEGAVYLVQNIRENGFRLFFSRRLDDAPNLVLSLDQFFFAGFFIEFEFFDGDGFADVKRAAPGVFHRVGERTFFVFGFLFSRACSGGGCFPSRRSWRVYIIFYIFFRFFAHFSAFPLTGKRRLEKTTSQKSPFFREKKWYTRHDSNMRPLDS